MTKSLEIQRVYERNLPSAKHNKDVVLQIVDRDGGLYRSDGEFWVQVTSDVPVGKVSALVGVDSATGRTGIFSGANNIVPTIGKSTYFNSFGKSPAIPTRFFVTGDSISSVGPYGTGVNAGEMYCSILASKFSGLTAVQCGIANSGINGHWHRNLVQESLTQFDVVLGLHGFNDMRRIPPSAAYLDDIQSAYEAFYAWCAVPESAKQRILAGTTQNPSVTATGTWTPWATFSGGYFGSYTSTNGATQTFNVSGDTVYVWYARGNGQSGAMTVTVDGVQYGALSSALSYTADNTYNPAWVPTLFKIKGLSRGAHTVVITTTNTGTCVVSAVAGFSTDTVLGPTVLAGNVLRMTAAGYALASYNANDPASVPATWSATVNPSWMYGDGGVESWNRRHKRAVDSLRADGLSVVHMDISARYNPATSATADIIHPTAVFHRVIAGEFGRDLSVLTGTSF